MPDVYMGGMDWGAFGTRFMFVMVLDDLHAASAGAAIAEKKGKMYICNASIL